MNEGIPLVSVVVVTHNAKEYLEICLKSIIDSHYNNIEIIVVDNDSDDGSKELVNKLAFSFPQIKLICNNTNLGLSIPRNQGAKEAKGKYIAFIDNDTRVHPAWLNGTVEILEKEKDIGAVQCKLILDDGSNFLDSIGEYMSKYGFLIHRVLPGKEKDDGRYDTIQEIFAAKGAGMIIRRKVLEKIGWFDEDYYFGLEETDLCWRIWLNNYRVVFIPNSIVYHKFGTSSVIFRKTIDQIIKFHGCKNYLTTLFKNLGFLNLIKIFPLHLSLWICILIYFLYKKDFKSSKWIFEGILWYFKNFKKLLIKRRIVQSRRKVEDREIFPKILKRASLNYFANNFKDVRKVGNATTWIKDK